MNRVANGATLGNRALQTAEVDNVATALADLRPGEIELLRPERVESFALVQAVRSGHKLAIESIVVDEPVVKLGVPIGRATRDIASGEWVHLHNCASYLDEKSSSLDLESGLPTDSEYE